MTASASHKATYARLAQSERENASLPQPRTKARGAILAGVAILAAFYMLVYIVVSVRQATSTTQGSKRELSLFGRYEKFKMQIQRRDSNSQTTTEAQNVETQNNTVMMNESKEEIMQVLKCTHTYTHAHSDACEPGAHTFFDLH